MHQNVLLINTSVMRGAVERRIEALEAKPELEELARICFEESRKNGSYCWLPDSDEDRFFIGCAAFLLLVDEKHRARIEHELRLLKAFSVATQGIPVDWESMIEEEIEPIGLIRIFKETGGDANSEE